MSFVGKLDQFPLTDLLQILASTGKSGKMSLTRRDGQGVIVLRRGKIIYAASSSARETLGNLMLCQGLIDEGQLKEALELQYQAQEEKLLGTILIEIGAVTREQLEEVLKQQVGKVVSEIMEWPSGYFRFDLTEIVDRGEIGVDAEDFLLSEGLGADEVLLDITSRLETLEEERRREKAEATTTQADRQPPAAAPDEFTGGHLESLKSVMNEIRSPEFTGEVTLQILDFARRIVQRGVLFYIRRGDFCGMGEFGIQVPGRGPEQAVRGIRIPVDRTSILAEAAERKATFRGAPADTEWNRYLLKQLGGGTPREAVVLPLLVNGEVLLVLYGDNLPEDGSIGDLTGLELLLLQAGLAMEKNLLQKRIEQFRQLRSH